MTQDQLDLIWFKKLATVVVSFIYICGGLYWFYPETIMSYTNITLCPQCGNITDDKCCNEDLILYESQHETFIDSIIPLIKEMSDD